MPVRTTFPCLAMLRVAALALSAGCGGPGQQGEPGQSAEPPVASRPQSPPGARVLITPADTTPCIAPEPDSAAAAAAALSLLSHPQVPLRVSSLLRHHDGMLVGMVPRHAYAAGGGGLVWVDRDGCLMVIKRSE